MDLLDYKFTKESIKKRVYHLYLEGRSTEEIQIITELPWDTIDNIIDCRNYLT